MTNEQEQEYREEAERLKALTRAEQRQVIAMHRAIAGNPSAGKAARRISRRWADALERLLNLPSSRRTR